jgi:hypothetical protein
MEKILLPPMIQELMEQLMDGEKVCLVRREERFLEKELTKDILYFSPEK